MKGSDVHSAFHDRLAFEGPLRVDLVVHTTPPDAERLRQLNLGILTAIETLGERRTELTDEDTPVSRELARLEARIDILTELLSRAVLPDTHLPPSRPVRLNVHGISGAGSETLAAGTSVLVRIHVDACRALPLELPGRVDAGHREFVAFEPMDERLRDALERQVFRMHRRAIADARAHVATPPPKST